MKAQWLTNFCAWLELTGPSQMIQTVSWIIPAVQTVHILMIACVIASATMIAFRSMGLIGQDQTINQFSARFLPFIWWPLLVLLATGLVMIIGEPARSLANAVFQLKMAMLVGAITATGFYQRKLAAEAPAGSAAGGPVLVLGMTALLLWVGIIFAGRWIAYT